MVKIGLVSAGNVGNAVVGFIFLAVVAKYLNLDDFGKYALLTSILLMFTKIIDFGTNSIFVTKSLTEEYSHHIINSFHTLKFLMYLICVPISLLILYFLGFKDFATLLIFILGLAAYTINLIFYAHFQKYENFLCLILLNTLPAIIKGGFALAIFFNYMCVDVLTAFSIFSLSIFADLLIYPFLPSSAKSFKIEFFQIKDIVTRGIPSGVSQLVQESWAAINNTIARILYGFNDVGIFSMANKISNIFTLISLSIFTVLLPKNAKRKNEKKKYDIKETFYLSLMVVALGFIAITISGIFLQAFFGDKFSDSIKILDILILASAIGAVNSFSENYFLVENKTPYILFINSLRVITFFSAALILTPMLQLEGLAYSNLASAVVSVITTSILIFKLSV